MSDEKKIYPEGTGESPHSGVTPGSHQVAVPGTDDIPNSTKATLKKYLSENSKKNVYSISAKTQLDPSTNKLSSQDSEIDYSENAEEKVNELRYDTNDQQFIDVNDDTEEAKNLRQLSDSGKFTDLENPETTLKSFIDKNKRGDGHNLLRSFVHTRDYSPEKDGSTALTDPTGRDKKDLYKIPDGAPEIQKRISEVLKTNRFSPSEESPYIRNNAYTDPTAALGSVQPKLGVYTPNTTEGNIAIEDMRKVAASLMLKQTGHAMGDSDPFEENTFSVLLGPDPLGFDPRIDVDQTLARNAHKGSNRRGRPLLDLSLDDEADDGFMGGKNPLDGDGEYISITDGGRSFGATNSYLETFTGNPLAAITFILQGLLTVFVTGVVIGIFLNFLMDNVNPERANGKDPSSLPFARHSSSPAAGLTRLGIPHLTHPIITCIAHGIAAFFRIDPPEDDLGNFVTLTGWFAGQVLNIIEFVPALMESQGFYVSIIRNVMRDNSSLLDVDPVAILADVAMATLTGGLRGLLKTLVTVFSGLASFKFFMACATVGEKSLLNEIRDFSGLRLIDRISASGPARAVKSRENKTTNALVWRHRSAPAMMMLPGNLIGAKVDTFNNPMAMATAAALVGDAEGEDFRRSIKFTTSNRFTPEEVKSFEDELESEYMPFYFQDLRTNEIISFHAFVDSISDSFSVQYADTPAYGRIDPVKIYTSTTRTINLSFNLVSTSQEDFDSMWYSVNKLTQMIYPQWSEGRKLSDGTNSFTMPFSQIPTASPMIRLRLGDFIRSNGSKFALARLFGAGAGNDKFSYGVADPSKSADEATKKMDKAKVQLKKSADIYNEKDAFKEGNQAILKRSTSHGYVTFPKPEGPGFLSFMFGPTRLPTQTWTRGDAVVEITKVEDRPEDNDDDFKKRMKKYKDDESALARKPYQYRVKFVDGKNNPANPNTDEDVELIVLATDLKPIIDDKVAAEDPLFDMDMSKNEFLKAENNVIMQAYESTRGRGLAGFITSMNFDYSQSTYEVGSLSRRAPIFLKVTMGFSPIHDIPPGMDANGANRAPLYPVGSISAHLAGDELADTKHFGIANKKDGFKDKFDLSHRALSELKKDEN